MNCLLNTGELTFNEESRAGYLHHDMKLQFRFSSCFTLEAAVSRTISAPGPLRSCSGAFHPIPSSSSLWTCTCLHFNFHFKLPKSRKWFEQQRLKKENLNFYFALKLTVFLFTLYFNRSALNHLIQCIIIIIIMTCEGEGGSCS